MNYSIIVLGAALLLGAFPTTVATACMRQENGYPSAACNFQCEGSVTVHATVTEWWNEWRSVEGHAYCDGRLRATCAGHGDCLGNGTGTGPGSCFGKMSGGGSGFRISCASTGSSKTSAAVSYNGGSSSGQVCSDGACQGVVPVCVLLPDGVACGIGVTEALLGAVYGGS